MPSRLINRKTRPIATPSALSGMIPNADSRARTVRMTNCAYAGRDRSRKGSGGMPIDIEERDKNTEHW